MLPASRKLQSNKWLVALQRRFGLFVSEAETHYDALEAEGGHVTEADRLGDTLYGVGGHQSAHKHLVIAWRDAEAASTHGVVYQGDKSLGAMHYSEFCASYTPDVIKLDNDDEDSLPEVLEIKSYSPIVRKNTSAPGGASLNGGVFLLGNTEERLKHKVLGARQRGVPSMEAFDHGTGKGYVPYTKGQYWDAIENRKSRVHLLVHEATFGGMSPYAAKRLRRLGRLARRRSGHRRERRQHP